MPCTRRAQTADSDAYSGESPSPFLSFLSFLPSFLGGIPARVPISQARRQAVDGADLWCSTLWTCLRQCLNGAAAAAGKLTGDRYVLPVSISLPNASKLRQTSREMFQMERARFAGAADSWLQLNNRTGQQQFKSGINLFYDQQAAVLHSFCGACSSDAPLLGRPASR